jgi:hypothetical protein
VSDARYRQIERRYLASGDPEAFNALIAEGIRSGNRNGVERIIAGIFTSYDIPFKTDPPHCRTSPVVFQVPMLSPDGNRAISLFSLNDAGQLESALFAYNIAAIPVDAYPMPAQPAKLLTLFPKNLVYNMETLVEVITRAILDQNNQEDPYFQNIVITKSVRQCGRFAILDDYYSVNPQCYLWQIRMMRGIDQIDLTLTLTRSPFGDNLEMTVETNLRYWNSSSDGGEVQGLRISGERYQNWGFGFDGDVDEEEYQEYENADTWDWFSSLDEAEQLVAGYFDELENII